MHPGMGVGEPAGGLGDGHAGDEPLPHGRGCGDGARVEPGERVGGGAERAEQRAQVGVGKPGGGTTAAVCRGRARCARDAQPIDVGFVFGVLPGRPESGVIVVWVGKPLSEAMAAFPQAVDTIDAAWPIRADSVHIGS